MARKKILLYADSFNGRVGISEPYVAFLSQFGEVILVSPDNDLQFFTDIGDVLAMPGGADVDPTRYGEAPSSAFTRTNPHFEFLDEFLLPRFIETGKPIIGICRGMQALNVTMGGSLFQHVNGHVGGEFRSVTDQLLFSDIEGYERYLTNSYHHQAVRRLAPNFDVLAWGQVFKNCPSLRYDEVLLKHVYDKKKGQREYVKKLKPNGQPELYYALPEIIKHQTRPYIGFQYHPEEFNCPLAVQLINEILNPE